MQNKHFKYIGLPVLAMTFAGTTAIFPATQASATTYSPYCTSATCRAAADAASVAAEKASEASMNASSLQGDIDRYTAEIEEIETRIEANEAMIEDLEKSIVETQEKLTRQRAALAKLTVKMYHDDNQGATAIDILAGSESISDLTEKQSRQETIEEQITKSAKEVNETKESLEQQQASVEATLAENEEAREEAADKQAELDELQTQYENDAEAYASEMAEQLSIVSTEASKAAAAARRYDTSGIVTGGGSSGVSGWWGTNTYPYASICPMTSYFYFHGQGCQCTSYAGWKAQEKWGVDIESWGNAKNWGNSAANRGYRVNDTPAPYTIGYSTGGTYGHVVWVESVNTNGTINITEYNFTYTENFSARTGVSASNYRYIHFN